VKRIIVTGHKGFIGSALMNSLAKMDSVNVLGLTRSEGKDLLEYESIKSFQKVDKIVHLAGTVGVMQSWENPLNSFKNNISSTLNIMEYARTHKIHVIYMSSYVYGKPVSLPVDEKHPVSCTNPYAESKLQSEMICTAYSKYFGVPVTILRPFNIYGPGQPGYNLISHLINQLKNNSIIQVKDLSPKRDYLYIDDLIDALLQVIFSDKKHFVCEIFNLGFGQSYSVQEVIDIISQLTNTDIIIQSEGKSRPNEIKNCYCNFQKFANRFSWKPQTNLKKGILNILKVEKLIE